MTQDEIREKLGLAPIEKKESQGAQDIINSLNSLSPLIATKVVESMDVSELRGLIGLPVRTEIVTPTEVITDPTQGFSDHLHIQCSISEHDAAILEKFEGKGIAKDKFKVIESSKMHFSSMDDFIKQDLFAEYLLNEVQKKIMTQIQRNENITIPQLAKIVGIDEASVISRINTLIDDQVLVEKISREGLITRSVTRTGDAAIKRLQPVTSFKVLYSYEERPNVPAAQSGPRPLCERLYGSGLFFTREEIQNISNQLGYSVFQLCGGWYTNPNTGRRTPFCRHEWKRNVVVEKTSR
jgi:DNA-binding MarR family transcriptional regulator